MPFDLTDDEQSTLMNAVQRVLVDYQSHEKTTIMFEDAPRQITIPAVSQDAPEPIKELYREYGYIIERGALASSPREVARHPEDVPPSRT